MDPRDGDAMSSTKPNAQNQLDNSGTKNLNLEAHELIAQIIAKTPKLGKDKAMIYR